MSRMALDGKAEAARVVIHVFERAVAALGVVALLAGCLPAGIFATARTLDPGAIEHVAFVDFPVTHYENPPAPQRPGQAPEPDPNTRDTGGPQLGYALRVGIVPRIELGASVSTSAGEVNAKIGIVDRPRVAVALAPRLASAWSLLQESEMPLYHARLPLLVTVDVSDWFSVTPRGGLGIARGRSGEPSWGTLDDFGGFVFVSEPMVEAGLTLTFRAGPRVALAFEAYGLRSINDAASQRELASSGAGFALIFGAGPRGHQR